MSGRHVFGQVGWLGGRHRKDRDYARAGWVLIMATLVVLGWLLSERYL